MTMKLEFLAILTVSVCLVFAAKRPCCFSKRFTANITIVTGTIKTDGSTLTVTENRLLADYDKDRRLDKGRGYILEGAGLNQTKVVYNTWNDYTTGKRYGFYNNYAATCFVGPLDTDQIDHCVPDTLILVSTYTIGSGDNSVRVNSWEGTFNNFQYTYVTTENDCTPVSVTRYGEKTDGTRMFEITQFNDFIQDKLSSDDALDIPKSCLTNGITPADRL